MPKLNDSGDRTYSNGATNASLTMANDKIREALSSPDAPKHISPAENSSGRDILSPEEYEYVAEHAEEMTEELSRDIITPPSERHSPEQIELIGKEISKDYKPRSNSEIVQKLIINDNVQRNYTRLIVERSMAVNLINSSEPALNRTHQALIIPKIDQESLEENQRIKRTLTEGSAQEQKDLIMSRLTDIADAGIPDVDYMDDRALAENIGAFSQILLIAPEIENLKNILTTDHGVDFSSEENKALNDKLDCLTDLGYIVRYRVDVISHPFYSQFNFESIRDKVTDRGLTNDQGENFDYMRLTEETELPYIHSVSGVLNQYTEMIELYSNKNCPLTDTSLRPEEREAAYAQWKAKLPRTEQLLDNINIINDILHDAEELPVEQRQIRLPLDRIEHYISDQRIDLQRRMQAQTERYKNVPQADVPEVYSRIMHTLYDKSGTPEAESKNKAITDQINATSEEGYAFRKKLYVDSINKARTMDASDVDISKGIDALAEAYLKDPEAYEVAPNLQDMLQKSESSLGFTLDEDVKDNVKKTVDKGVALGGKGLTAKNVFKSEFCLSVPFEDLSKEQLQVLLMNVDELADRMTLDEDQKQDLKSLLQYQTSLDLIKPYQEPGEYSLDESGIVDIKPDIHTLAGALAAVCDGMLDYRKSLPQSEIVDNSPREAAMASAAGKAMDLLHKLDGQAADPQAAQDLRKAIAGVTAAGSQYLNELKKNSDPAKQGLIDTVENALLMTKGAAGSTLLFNTFIENYNQDPQKVNDLSAETKEYIDAILPGQAKGWKIDILPDDHNEAAYNLIVEKDVDPRSKTITVNRRIAGFIEEAGLSADDLVNLAESRGLSAVEYLNLMVSENLAGDRALDETREKLREEALINSRPESARKGALEQNTESPQAAEDQAKKTSIEFKTLGDLERFLEPLTDPQNPMAKVGPDDMDNLVNAFRFCNKLAADSYGSDMYKCYQSGELLQKAGKLISDVLTENPTDKPVLNSKDISAAKTTLKMHRYSAEKMKAETSVTPKEAKNTIARIDEQIKGRGFVK